MSRPITNNGITIEQRQRKPGMLDMELSVFDEQARPLCVDANTVTSAAAGGSTSVSWIYGTPWYLASRGRSAVTIDEFIRDVG